MNFGHVSSTADKARIIPYTLRFKRPAGTSRGILTEKQTYFLILEKDGKRGIGEIALFRGLSAEDKPDFEKTLQKLKKFIFLPLKNLLEEFKNHSSIIFGLEQAILSLHSEDPFLLFPSAFTAGKEPISINGLIWMGDQSFMLRQIDEKIAQGFHVIKMKIGALDFATELKILAYIREHFSDKDLEIRVDANGAFSPRDAFQKLEQLAEFDLHSIEQPIGPGQWEDLARLCEISPVPIALDEELIGKPLDFDRRAFLELMRPHYIILKPSLHGGMTGSDAWIDAAENTGTGWWITSALESNIGLNALAQYAFFKGVERPQGLGTGSLFVNNFPSPLYVKSGALHYNPTETWEIPLPL